MQIWLWHLCMHPDIIDTWTDPWNHIERCKTCGFTKRWCAFTPKSEELDKYIEAQIDHYFEVRNWKIHK